MKLSKFNNYYNRYGKSESVDLTPIKNEVANIKNDVATNLEKINSNTENITNNTNQITTNATNIAGNLEKITNNTNQITTNANNIAGNLEKITDNTTKIQANTTKINENFTTLNTNLTNLKKEVDGFKDRHQEIKIFQKVFYGDYKPGTYNSFTEAMPHYGKKILGNPNVSLSFNIGGVSLLYEVVVPIPNLRDNRSYYVGQSVNVINPNGSSVGTINIVLEALTNGTIWCTFTSSISNICLMTSFVVDYAYIEEKKV